MNLFLEQPFLIGLVINILVIGICFAILYRLITHSLFLQNQKHIKDFIKYIGKIESRMAKPYEEFHSPGNRIVWTVIITLNRPDLLQQTIFSLKEHEPESKILVIDNGSESNTLQLLTDLLNQKMIDKVIYNQKDSVAQWQKAFAITQALKVLSLESVDYICFMDDDIEMKLPSFDFAITLLDQLKPKGVRLINFLLDRTQNKNHPTLEKIDIDGTEVHIKESFNGAFFFMSVAIIKEIGFPPVGEGICISSTEDWYYSRIFQAKGWKTVAIDRSVHKGYKNSKRLKTQPIVESKNLRES